MLSAKFFAAPIPITTSTTSNPAPRALNTSAEYRVADSATLAFLNGAGASGTDGGVFAFNNTAQQTLILMPDGATDSTGISAGTGAVVFSGNSAGKNGGAISITNASSKTSVYIANAVFAQNSALGGNGGAITSTGYLRVDSALFSENTASSGGGALYNSSTAWLTNVVFSANAAFSTGGAITNSAGLLTISSGTFDGNIGASGGALNNTGAASNVTLADVVFSNNLANGNSSANGGAINTTNGAISATNALFASNTAWGNSTSNGGAIYATSSTLALTGAVFTNNTAKSLGGAIYATNSSLVLNIATSATSDGNKAGSSGTATVASGGFLYLTNTAAVTFNITGSDTTYTIGDATAADRGLDSIASTAGNGVITKTGDGALVLNADDSGYRGAIAVTAGALLLGNAAAKLNATSITVSGGALGGSGTITGAIEFQATSTLFVGGNLSIAAPATSSLTLRDGATIGGSGTLSTGANTALLDSGTIAASVAQSDTLAIAGALTGAGALEKTGAGALALTSTANTFSGGVDIAAGALLVSASGQLGSPANAINFTGSSTLALAAAAPSLALANTIAVAPGVAATIDTSAGTLALTGALLSGDSTSTLVKTGAGALALAGANAENFDGTLLVAQGSLLVSTSAAQLGGNLALDPGASLGFGAAPAQLVVAGTLALNSATLNFNLYSGTSSGGYGVGDSVLAASVASTGANIINIIPTVQTGTYDLGTLTALAGAQVTIDGAAQVPDARQGATLQTSGSLLLITTQMDMSRVLTWTGGGADGADWTNATAGQWTDNASVTRFADGDRVIFDGVADSANPENRAVTVQGANGVVVSDMIVSGSEDYTFLGAPIVANAASLITGTLTSASGRLVKTGPGTLAFENAADTFLGGIELGGGALVFATAAQLGDGGNGITFTGDATLALSASAAPSVEISNKLALAPGATATLDTGSSTLVLGGAVTGSGALAKAGSGALVLAAASDYTGATTLAAGTLRAAAANVFSPNSAYAIAAGATLDLNGYSQTLASVASGGLINLGAGAPALNVTGNFNALPGSVVQFTLSLFDNASPQIGALAINGGVTGQTTVSIQVDDNRVATASAALPATLAPLITTATPAAADAFTLAGDGRVVIGAYDYILQANSPLNATAWSLVLDNLTPEVPAVAGTDALALQSSRAALDSLGDHLADLRVSGAPDRKHGLNLWLDGLYRRDTVNQTIYSGASISIGGAQAGADFMRKTETGMVALGIFADFARAEMLMPSRVETDADIHGAGLYATIAGNAWYLDAIVRGAESRYTMQAPDGAALTTDGATYGASVEVGRPWKTKSGWTITPLAALAWQRFGVDDATDTFGRAYTTQDFTSLAARLGVAFEKAFAFKNAPGQTLIPSVRIGAAEEFQGRSNLTVAGTQVESDLGGLGAELNAGLVWRAGRHWSASAHVAATAGGKFDGYSVNLGVARAW